jgi:pimeloyl-ACP methyl ester carboxylesterase
VEATIELADGRSVGFATYGQPDGTAVVWCHGGPGSRMEPAYLGAEAADAGLLLIGIDRPGYGISTSTKTSVTSAS